MKKNKEKNVIKSVYGYFLPSAWKVHKGYFFARAFKIIVTAVSPFLSIIFLPLIIEELMGNRNPQVLLGYVAIVVFLEFIFGISNGTLVSIIERYSQKFENYYTNILSKRIMELDFKNTEDKKALDQLELAKNGMSWYSGGLNGLMDPLFDIVSRIITLVGVTYIIVSKAPILLFLTIAILVVTGFVNEKVNKIEREGFAELSKINRIFGYIGWELADFRYGKDIRLFDAKDMMIAKWSYYTEEMNSKNENIANKQLPLLLINMLTGLIRDLGTYFYLGFLAIMGKISIAACTQLINSASVFTECLNSILNNYQTIIKRANYANEFVQFLDYPLAMQKGKKPIHLDKHVFEFQNVSFSYPGSESKVLQHMNLTIEEGEHLSIVGLNGAGKTTMIKLLCRLYDPTEGRILMDGIDIREYDYKQYMSVFAPVFQDFKLFAFTMRENLLLRDSFTASDEEKVENTLKKIGLYEKVLSFKNGLATNLYKQFDEDGIEPSGGEQQKLAIARALIKNAPVVVLDEPTAALDPIAEYEIYRQFEYLVKGKTAIYISHRLSSCQFCDKIAVFSEGKVKEYGTHAELVDIKDGLYAEMFAAQAQYYVSTV